MSDCIKKAVFALLVFGLVLAVRAGDASATNINTHAAACMSNSGYLSPAYESDGVINYWGDGLYVVCSIPRSPLAGTSAGFFIDGLNPGTKTTTVTVYSYNYNGTFLGSASAGQTGGGSFDLYVTLTSAQVPMYAYVGAVVIMPMNGKLFGVTSVQ